MILGIDPGYAGGLAFLRRGGVSLEPMPRTEFGDIDTMRIRGLIVAHKPWKAYIEKPFARPLDGSHSMMRSGIAWGIVFGVLTAYDVPVEQVRPQEWHQTMHAGCDGHTSKDRSVQAFARYFPGVDARTSERCRNPHLGMVEAALIGAWGAKKYGL